MQAAKAFGRTQQGEDFTGHAIEISRFTATAASFTSERAVQQFVEAELGTLPEALARQMLLPEVDIARIITNRDASAASLALLAHVRRTETKRAILAASKGMARRLVAHVRTVANPQPGDTLMLIDLGYNGTVQNRIAAVLEKS